MIPIVTPAEMAAIDADAPEPVGELIERAGAALARTALDMLGGSYGRRVTVLVGKGNNGADGRAAARRLQRRGVRTAVIDSSDAPGTPGALPAAHLIIDAAYGTGLRRPYVPPTPVPSYDNPGQAAPILAADIPSGVDGLTGEIHGQAWIADRTVAFGALKPGLILHPGAQHCGHVTVDTIGLDVSPARTHLAIADDVSRWLPVRPAESHKWLTACWIIAGSPGMTGAACLAASAALRGGSGYVRLSTPGLDHSPAAPIEAVGCPLPAKNWAAVVSADDFSRFKAMLVGPGLGRQPTIVQEIRSLVAKIPLALVIDGDGLYALGSDASELLTRRIGPTVLTPHDGEYRVLTGKEPAPDRFAAARSLAAATNAFVLLKGPTTVVASPDGAAVAIANGDARLATAGTGDVLAGLICGLLSAGVEPMNAAAAAAWLHGQAGNARPSGTMVASDLLGALPEVWSAIATQPRASARPSAWEADATPTTTP